MEEYNTASRTIKNKSGKHPDPDFVPGATYEIEEVEVDTGDFFQ